MEFSRITARGQTTIPKRVRDAANLREGDVVAFDIRGGHLVLTKVTEPSDGYLEALSGVMDEWYEPEDEVAWQAANLSTPSESASSCSPLIEG